MKNTGLWKEKILFFRSKNNIKFNKKKNNSLSENLKLNIIKELSGSKFIDKKKINNISINSKSIKKNDIFFAIKGKSLMEINLYLKQLKKDQV